MLKTLNLSNFGLPILGTIASLAIAAPSHAVAVTVLYDFNSNFNAKVTGSPRLTASAITQVGEPTSSGGGVATFTSAQPNDFFTFTLTQTAPSINLNLSTFTFFARRNGSGPTSLSLFSSLDGFTTAIDTVTGVPANTFPGAPQSFNIGGAAFDNITAPITFRVVNNDGASAGRLAIDDLTVKGALTVPYEFETGVGVLLFAGYFVGKRYLKNKAVFKA
ncbi:hypothetical protein [Synechococcus sp. PCC 7502]|uniref:PFE-CTERM domain-containing protein n=1 Tax=Synechococcus sp. PCC 7502 TaxID=1173263 RepID=UPI0002FE0EAC|nr:hypothetical protein [Synechococcus sp. PCC 7502]